MMDNRWFGARFRPVVGLFALVGLLALSACGGGGGAPGSNVNVPPPTGPGPQVLTVQPSQPVIYSKVPSVLSVTSGTAPYHAFSSDTTTLPVASTITGNSLTLLASAVAAPTTVTLTIQDNVGSTVNVPVVVNPELVVVPPALIVLPPTLDAFAGVPSQIGVFGGVAPYRAFSSNSAILPVSQNVTGNAVPLLAAAVSANTPVTITILDSVGQVGTVLVTVHAGSPSPPPALVVLPASQDAYSGIATQLTVSGGVPPYRAFSTNTAILPVVQNVVGNAIPLLAAAVTGDTTITIAVQDAVGQTVTVPVTVHPKPVVPPPPLSALPTTLDAFPGVPTQITAIGGVAPYRAFTTNSAVLPVTQDVDGNTVPLVASMVTANTPVTVTIMDSVGQVATVAVTVHAPAPPPALLVQPASLDAFSGIATQLTVSGGTPPYRAFSTNTAILPVTQDVVGNTVPLLPATVTANTAVTISVQDSVGQTVTVPVTVHPKPVVVPPALLVLPATLDAFAGIPTQITIVGGVAPYLAFSTNSAILPVTQAVTGNAVPLLAATVAANTAITVTILDSAGQVATVAVTVHPGPASPPPALVVLPLTLDAFAGTPTQVTISGGVAPYRAFSTNSAILPVTQSVTGNNVPLVASAVAVNTPVTLTIMDSVGQVATVAVIVHPGSASPLLVQPASLDAFSGIATQLTVAGGMPPYHAFSTNSAILPVTQDVAGSTIPLLAATVTANTSVTISVQDAVGQTVTVPVTVHPKPVIPPPALILLPATVDAFAGVPTQITVIGGVAPYLAFSTNSAILPVTQTVAGNTVPLLAAPVAANTPVTVTILDSAGQVATVAVTVHAAPASPPPALVVLPTSLDAFAGVATQITVTGGVAPYRAFSTNSAILPVAQSVTGNTVPLLAAAVAVNTPVTVAIQDSVGQIATVVVTVHPGSASPPPALVVQPTSLDAFSGTATQLNVAGGVPPYRAFSTNSAILPVTQDVAGNTIPLLAATVTANTAVTISVQDSAGQTITVPVTVHPKPVVPPPALLVLPTALDAFAGIPTQVTVIGGVAPYLAFSTNPAVLPVTQAVAGNTVPLLAAAVAANTPVTLTILDSAGQVATVAVTVHAGPASPPPALVVLPTSLDAFSGIATQLTVAGGVAPYRAFSTNSAILPVTQSVTGNSVPLLAATVTANTNVSITIQDSVGQTVTVPVVVHPQPVIPPPALVALPTALDAYSGIPTQITVVGGVAPYSAFSTNTAVLPVTQAVAGNTIPLLAADVSAAATVLVSVRDSVGQTVVVTVTVHPRVATPSAPLVVLPTDSVAIPGIATRLTISGGQAPYRAFSTNSAALPVDINVSGNTILLIANPVTVATPVVVTIQDSVGQTVNANVTVRPSSTATPAPLVVLPTSITVSKGVPFTLTISGGASPFFAYSSNPGILPVALNVPGNSLVLTANAVSVDTNVAVTVQDSAGQTTSVTVLIKADSATPPPPLTILPGTSIVFSGVPATLLVSGGVPPYLAFSSNSAVLPVAQAVGGNVIALFAANVAVDTTVTITVQDSSAQKTTTTASVTVRPAPLLNTLTITPNFTTCGTNTICSGQDGTAVVTVQLPGGGPAAGRQERFEAVFGPYGIAQSASGAILPSQTVTSDSAGHAQVIIKANVDAPTQFAQIRVTDVTSGQQLIGNFLIVQSTDGSTILTVVPTTVTITGPFKGVCSTGFRVDYYIYGGTPPYRITHGFPDALILLTPTVDASGGFFEAVTNGGCVNPDNFSIVDATGRVTTATINNVEGTDPIPAPPVIVVPDLAIVPGDISPATCVGATFPFVITGGTPPYNITASPRIGGSPTITPSVVNASGGETDVSNVTATVTLSFVDSSSPKKGLSRNITCPAAPGPPALLVNPSAGYDYTAAVGGCVNTQSNFVITGGTPPYFVSFPNPSIGVITPPTVPASGGGFIVTGLKNTPQGGLFQTIITVKDSGAGPLQQLAFPTIQCP